MPPGTPGPAISAGPAGSCGCDTPCSAWPACPSERLLEREPFSGAQQHRVHLGLEVGRQSHEEERRPAVEVGAEAEERRARQVIRAPVDGNDEARPQQSHGLDGVPRAHVFELGHERTDAGDRQHGEVQPLGPHVGDAGEEAGVPGKVDTSRPRDDVAEARGASRQGVAGAAVLRVRAHHLERPDVQALAGTDLVDLPEPAPAQRQARPHRREDRGVAPEQAQRPRIVVVEVQVRDEDHVGIGERFGEGPRHTAVQRADETPQHRVGDEAHAVHLDDCRRVSQERHPGPGPKRPRPGGYRLDLLVHGPHSTVAMPHVRQTSRREGLGASAPGTRTRPDHQGGQGRSPARSTWDRRCLEKELREAAEAAQRGPKALRPALIPDTRRWIPL